MIETTKQTGIAIKKQKRGQIIHEVSSIVEEMNDPRGSNESSGKAKVG
jgi:hypothetical protein